MKRYQKVFAVLFLLLTMGLSICNILDQKEAIAHYISEIDRPQTAQQLQSVTSQIDSILVENIIGDHSWNELYGAVYKGLGKKEENNFTYVKDKNNFLYSGNFWNTSEVDARNLALRMRKMQDAVDAKGTKVVYIMYPTKYNEAWSEGYYGIPYNNMNDFADDFLLQLRRYNVDYIDFRDVFTEAGMTMEDIFYKTDHHWNVPTAFFSTGVILDHLKEKYGDDLDPDGFYMNLENYTIETYEDIYMGSQGRETGSVFAGELDDYTYIYPNFETEYTYSYSYRTGETGSKTGTAAEALISNKYLTYEDAYDREMNNSYLQGICLTDEIINEQLENGKKVLFIRDSYSSPVATFMAPMCKEIDMCWSIHLTGDQILKKVEVENYDYIFVALAIDNLTDTGIPVYGEEVTEELTSFTEINTEE